MGEVSEVIIGKTLGAALEMHMAQNGMRNKIALFV